LRSVTSSTVVLAVVIRVVDLVISSFVQHVDHVEEE
jgi:hypothetical protein